MEEYPDGAPFRGVVLWESSCVESSNLHQDWNICRTDQLLCSSFHEVSGRVMRVMCSPLPLLMSRAMFLSLTMPCKSNSATMQQTTMHLLVHFFFNKFSPNPLIGRIGKDRALAKQSLLRWPCPLPSDRAIPSVLSSSFRSYIRVHLLLKYCYMLKP